MPETAGKRPVSSLSGQDQGAQIVSLAHLTVVKATPLELLDAAAAGAFNAIGLRIHPPMPTDTIFPVVGDERMIREIEIRRVDLGVQILDAEAIWLTPDTDVKALEPVVEVAARLGASNLLVVGNDREAARQLENYGQLCDLAAAYGLTAAVEFIPYCVTSNLHEAQELVLGVGRPNAKFLIDVLHLMRSGDGPDVLTALQPHVFAYCQLSDYTGTRPASKDLLRIEARTDRHYPGQGEAPLVRILDALPPNLPLGVEAPAKKYAHLPVIEQGRLCGEATRSFLQGYLDGH